MMMSFQRAMLMGQASKRLFSTHTAAMSAPMIKTQYLMQMARIKVQLPQEGDTWFFVRPNDTIENFRNEISSEDDQIKTVEVFESADGKARKELKESASLYETLKSSQSRVILSLNGMEYEFDRECKVRPENLFEESKASWFTKCRQANLSKMHSSTIATVLQQVQMNLPSLEAEAAEEPATKGAKGKKSAAPTVSVQEVCDTFID